MAQIMKKTCRPSLWDEAEGAVTVDWVVLTAAIVSLGMLAGAVVWNNSGSVARNVSSYLASQSVISTF